MWSDASPPREEQRKNDIACHSCRRRKVKCGHELPICLVCEQTGQECSYPVRPKKPGPKIGSFQRQKRQRRDRQQQQRSRQQESQVSNSPPASQASLDRDDADCDRRSSSSYRKDPGNAMDVDGNEWSTSQGNTKLNIHDLSFILHPSHEASTPEKDASTAASKDTPEHERQSMVRQACCTLGVSQAMIEQMIRIYFENMVAINLFHEPSFLETLSNITSTVQISALLAAIMGYAARFYQSGLESASNNPLMPVEPVAPCPPPDHFLGMALKLIDAALVECDDEPPSICVLQALIIATHCQLTHGVHGKAWRSLGMCVRLAYELNLHLVDARGVYKGTTQDPIRWRDAEEQRRAWWAIWEMDVFASTIRRTPTAIDWAQMETLLPVDDSDWFQNRPAPSAFMERDPVQRWKSLQDTGNQSPKAWYLVINSLMKDAQIISSPRGVPFRADVDQRQPSRATGQGARGRSSGSLIEARQKLEMLANSVQCFVLALPGHLRYHNQYLGFDAPVPGVTGSMRQLHCSVYNIFVMTQLARLMIYRYDLFGNTNSRQTSGTGQHTQRESSQSSSEVHDPDNTSVRQYFEAADNILMIVNRSCEDHIQHINPFLLSTIWLASAVQLVRKYIDHSSNTNPSLIKSRFNVLHLTYKRCADFWDVKTAMEQNLESLETQLEGHYDAENNPPSRQLRKPAKGACDRPSRQPSSWIPNGAASDCATLGSDAQGRAIEGASATQRILSAEQQAIIPMEGSRPEPAGPQNESTRTNFEAHPSSGQGWFMPNSPPATIISDTYPTQLSPTQAAAHPLNRAAMDHLKPHTFYRHRSHSASEVIGDTDPSMLDFLPLSTRITRPHALDTPSSALPVDPSMIHPGLFDPTGPHSLQPGDMDDHSLEWRHLDLPIDVHDLLSGVTTY